MQRQSCVADFQMSKAGAPDVSHQELSILKGQRRLEQYPILLIPRITFTGSRLKKLEHDGAISSAQPDRTMF